MNQSRIKIGIILVLSFLLCLFCSCSSKHILSDSELSALTFVRSTSGASSETGAEDSLNADKIAALSSLIVMYSEQLEEFDRSSGIFVATCITFIVAILGIILTLYSSWRKKNDNQSIFALAAVFLTLPSATTLCLYVFSMQCRRVVFFRGYLWYLEDQLSTLIGIPMLFNKKIALKFFDEFLTNRLGPGVMTIFLVVVFFVCFFCIKSILQPITSKPTKTRQEKALIFVACLVFAVCVLFSLICAFDLSINVSVKQ